MFLFHADHKRRKLVAFFFDHPGAVWCVLSKRIIFNNDLVVKRGRTRESKHPGVPDEKNLKGSQSRKRTHNDARSHHGERMRRTRACESVRREERHATVNAVGGVLTLGTMPDSFTRVWEYGLEEDWRDL